MEVRIIMSKCSVHNRVFGMRVEKRGNRWVRTWAFKIDEAKAKREGYDKSTISGSFAIDEKYPGCPYCGEIQGMLRCNCGKISCWNVERKSGRCHWCKVKIEGITFTESINVKSGQF